MSENISDHELNQKSAKVFFAFTAGFFVFILYASLLPFSITSDPVDTSIAGFINTLRFSHVGEEQGQWIAHVIFNILLTFSACLYCVCKKNTKAFILMILAIVALGFLIEFLQMFMGARGTSMADIFANLGGIFIGICLCAIFGNFTIKAVKHIIKYNMLPIKFVKRIYLAFVIVIILFPFDFFMNAAQLQEAFLLKGVPLFEADRGQGIGFISLISSVLLLFPLGVLYRMAKKKRSGGNKQLIVGGSVFLLLLEIVQFFEVSGQSSLLSFICKLIGFCLGLYVGRHLSLPFLFNIMIRLKLLFLLMLPIFLWIVLKIKGLSIGQVSTIPEISNVIGNMSLLPFNYYIEVGSAEALLSFMLNFIIYIPFGIYLAIHKISKNGYENFSFLFLMVLGVTFAFLIEGSVLFWGLKRPDVTNILIASVALPIGYYFVMMAQKAICQNKVI